MHSVQTSFQIGFCVPMATRVLLASSPITTFTVGFKFSPNSFRASMMWKRSCSGRQEARQHNGLNRTHLKIRSLTKYWFLLVCQTPLLATYNEESYEQSLYITTCSFYSMVHRKEPAMYIYEYRLLTWKFNGRSGSEDALLLVWSIPVSRDLVVGVALWVSPTTVRPTPCLSIWPSSETTSDAS